MYGIHSVIASKKKLDKTKASGEAVDAMRHLVAELLPLANAVASLKSKVIKGRMQSAGTTKTVNPDKVVKTCPCCLRAIDVQKGKMVHHGYSRPSIGGQTSSCPGIQFPPLESSTQGLVWIIDQYKIDLAEMENRYENSDKWQSVPYCGLSGLQDPIEIGPDSPFWPIQFQGAKDTLKGQIFQTKCYLKELEKKLADCTID